MKLHELKFGMRCTNREGDTFIVDNIDGGTINCQYSPEGIFQCNGMREDLTNEDFFDLDIMKVEDVVFTWYETIWEREDH